MEGDKNTYIKAKEADEYYYCDSSVKHKNTIHQLLLNP